MVRSELRRIVGKNAEEQLLSTLHQLHFRYAEVVRESRLAPTSKDSHAQQASSFIQWIVGRSSPAVFLDGQVARPRRGIPLHPYPRRRGPWR